MQTELAGLWEREHITMIFVTHDVDEAIYLGDRVVVMARRPGRIRTSFRWTSRGRGGAPIRLSMP